MIIDFHTHCFTDNVAKSAIPVLEAEGNVKALHDGTLGGLRACMARCGIDISVIQPVATKPSQVGTINDWARQNRSDDLLFFGAVHPDDPDFLGTARQLKEDGFPGVKLHPDYQNFITDEDRMMPLYETLAELGLIVLFHAGVDIGLYNLVHCTPLMIRRVMDTVPDLTIVAAHMGSHALWHDVEELLLGRDLYIDTSYSWYQLGEAGMMRMIQKHGADRVLFGTDSPWTCAEAEAMRIRSLPLPDVDIDAILYRNAQRLLGLSPV